VISAPILVFPDETQPFRVEADSSNFATGVVLSQQSLEDDKWHPVTYYSKSLNAMEWNYKIHDKEMLAVIQALEDWRHFLEGAHHKFEIWTDHKNLEYLMMAKKLNHRQAQWSLYLSRFNFAMHHRPGHFMGKSDALSHRVDHGTGTGDNSNVMLLCPEFFAAHAIRALSGLSLEGEEHNILWDIHKRNREGKQEDTVANSALELRKSKGKSVRASEWSEHDRLLCFWDQIYVPNDPELCHHITSQHHDTRVAGHPGRWKTLELVSRSYWWPQMSRYIGQYVKTCDPCLQTKIQQCRPTGELHPLPTPESHWDVISVDFIVELPDSHGYDAVMNVVDSVGKRAHFIPTNTTITALGAARLFLHNVWKLHGLPCCIVSDWGPQFVAEFTRELYRLLGITLSTTTTYHPQADGQMEHVNQELEQYL
jgi:RNase H-like domain found in reverse transcriptase/Integrase zinc binding domain